MPTPRQDSRGVWLIIIINAMNECVQIRWGAVTTTKLLVRERIEWFDGRYSLMGVLSKIDLINLAMNSTLCILRYF